MQKDAIMVVIRDKAAVLDAALALDQVCYYWSITLDPESAIAFAERCQEMNAANNAALTYLVQSVNASIPTIDFGPDNPNTGRMHHDFIMGCETAALSMRRSQVLLASLDKW